MKMKKMMTFVLLVICIVVLIGLKFQPSAYAEDYFVKSIPLYALEQWEDVDAASFGGILDWFMTTSVAEMNNATTNGWKSKGIACYTSPVQITGTVPLYRMYNSTLADHFYPSNSMEWNNYRKLFYVPEGIVGYVFPKNTNIPGTVPLYRFYISGSASYHRYSTKPETQNTNESYQGIECYVWPSEKTIVSMSLTAPQQNEELKGMSDYNITWNSSVKGGYVSLHYSTDAGNTWTPIEYGLLNKGFTKWRVPNVNTQLGRIQIVWRDNLFGESNVLAKVESPFNFRIKKITLKPGAKPIVSSQMDTKTSAPMGLTAKASSTSEIKLAWKASTGKPIAYAIEKRIGEKGSFLQVANIKAPGLTYSDKNVSPGTTYFYRVYAYNMAGRSGNSNETSAKIAFTLKKTIPVKKKLPK